MVRRLTSSAPMLLIALLLGFSLLRGAEAQFGGNGLPRGPSAMGVGERSGYDLSPSNPLSMPGSGSMAAGGSTGILVNNSMLADILPDVPNLQWGYLWTFGGTRRMGRLIVDYTAPFRVTETDVVFGEVHGRFEEFLKTIGGSDQPAVQLLAGGGYRKRVSKICMVGVNGFYNTARLGGKWYASGIAGLEFSALTYGDGVLDASVNYFGNIFHGRESIIAAFRYGPGDIKAEVSYTQSLFNKNLLVSLKASRYVFQHLGNIRGYYMGGDVHTSDGLFKLAYVTGFDQYNQRYHNIGVYLTFGLRLENLLSFRNPLSRPGSQRTGIPW